MYSSASSSSRFDARCWSQFSTSCWSGKSISTTNHFSSSVTPTNGPSYSSSPMVIECSFTQSFNVSPFTNAPTDNSANIMAIGQPNVGRINTNNSSKGINQLLSRFVSMPKFSIVSISEGLGLVIQASLGCKFRPKGIFSPK